MDLQEFTRVPPRPRMKPDGYDEDWTPLWLPRRAAEDPIIEHQQKNQDHVTAEVQPPDPLIAAFMGAIYQARKRADSEIAKEDAMKLWARCGGLCEVSGIPFSLERADKRFARRPWAPSIDQIDAGKGYGLDNIRVVCIAVNYAMNHWGEDVLLKIATALLASRPA